MTVKLLLALRYLAIAVMIIAIALIFVRRKLPLKDVKRDSKSYWNALRQAWLKARERQRKCAVDMQALRNRTALIVDPDTKSQRVMQWRLHALQCRTITAKTGTQALERMRAEQVDVIIADSLLPDVSAIDFYRSLYRTDTPLVFVGVLENQWEDLQGLGTNVACLRKPYDPEEAAVLAGRILRRNGLNDAIV